MKLLLIIFLFIVTALGEEIRQGDHVKTPQVYVGFFERLQALRAEQLKRNSIITDRPFTPDVLVDWQAEKQTAMSELTNLIGVMEALLDNRQGAAVEAEVVRDLDAIARYVSYSEADRRGKEFGGGRHHIADRQLDYLKLRIVKILRHCRDQLHWDYDFQPLIESCGSALDLKAEANKSEQATPSKLSD